MNDRDEILISLKPRYAAEIFAGEKTVELRKRRPKVEIGTVVWIYVTTPVSAIRGYATVAQIETATPALIWKTFGGKTGVSKSEFDQYFRSSKAAHALVLANVMEMKRVLSLNRIRELVGDFHPPQFFYHLNGARASMRLARRKYLRVKS